MAILQEIFKSVGLENDRFKLTWISASDGQKFARVGREFHADVITKGENPSKFNIFL